MENGNGHSAGKSYLFGRLTLDPLSRTLIRDGAEVHLPQRPFDILLELVENRDRVVSRNELLDKFWDGHDVYDDALRKCVGSIRKAIGDTSRPAAYIETRYGGGYRFIGEVEVNESGRNGSNAMSNADSTVTSIDEKPRFPKWFRTAAVSAVILLAAILTLGFFVVGPGARSTATNVQEDPSTRIRTIAVMPLKNLTGKLENDYFSDGVTDSIITELARANDLKVISRGSTFSLKGRETDPRQVGRDLGVDALLEGTVQAKGGNVVNVRVRLIDTTDGSVIWTSNDFEREFSAAADLQDIIACNVASELRTELCGTEGGQNTRNGIAYQEYLKGRFEWNKRTADGIKKSFEHFNRAILADPNYALAYSGLAESYVQGIWHIPMDSSEAVPKAREMALKAVALNPNLAESRTALASIHGLEWKWNEAIGELDRAIALSPRFARAHHVKAFMMMITGRHDESIASIDRAAEFDPANLVIKTDKGNLLHAAGRDDEAFEQWNRTIALDPNFLMAREHRLVGYESVGDEKGSIDEYAEILKLKNTPQRKIDELRRIGQRSGFRELRRLEYRDLLARKRKGDAISPAILGLYCSLLGLNDEAFKWFDEAVKQRSSEIVLMLGPAYAPLHADPRYPGLLNKIGL